LLWYFFPGDVEMVAGGTALTSTVGSVPALHFVAAMIGARDAMALSINSRYSYGFTEADQCINFERSDDDVRVECTFSPNVLTVPFDEFSREVCNFARRDIQALGQEFSALLVHPFVHDLLRRCEDERDSRSS
jgi:hypothetical protein